MIIAGQKEERIKPQLPVWLQFNKSDKSIEIMAGDKGSEDGEHILISLHPNEGIKTYQGNDILEQEYSGVPATDVDGRVIIEEFIREDQM